MKLAEALSIRSQLTNKVTQLRSRLNDCVKIQEGDEIAETPHQVVEELDSTLAELRRIIYAINMTNTLTMDENGRNITYLIAERDTLKQRVSILSSAVETLTQKESRYNRAKSDTSALLKRLSPARYTTKVRPITVNSIATFKDWDSQPTLLRNYILLFLPEQK